MVGRKNKKGDKDALLGDGVQSSSGHSVQTTPYGEDQPRVNGNTGSDHVDYARALPSGGENTFSAASNHEEHNDTADRSQTARQMHSGSVHSPATADPNLLEVAELPGTLPGSMPPGVGRSGAGPTSDGGASLAPLEIQEALLPPRPTPAFEHPISPGRRRWMVVMFCLVAALLFADQNLLAPNLTEAANYFGMSERQKDTLLGGALMAAFFAVGAPAALVVGWLTDRGDINRRTLLFWVVIIGEFPCLLTYWVTAFWQFFLLRALTGVAVGGCFPLVFSLLGDLFPPRKRAAISAVVQIATGVGLAVGQALSGAIGPATNWRVPFVVVAAPSLLVAVVMQLTTREPPRGAFEEALQERYAEGGSYEGERISWRKVAVLLRCPSNVLVIGQGLPGSLPWGMILTFFNDFLSQNKGFTVQAATLVLLFFGGGGAVGVIAGGAAGQWLYNKKKEYQALLAGGSVLLGIAPLYVLINADLQSVGLGGSCVLAALGGAVASVAGPNLRSVMLNVNEPDTRGVALALQAMTDDLGKGLGPVLVAGLIHAMGRQGAFNVATGGWIPCSIMLTSLACFMRRDEAAMQSRLAAAADKQAEAAAAARRAAAGEAVDGEGGGITGIIPMPASPTRGVTGSSSGRGGHPSLPPGLPGYGVGGSAHVGLPGAVPHMEYGGLGQAPPYGYGWQQGGGGAPGWPAEDRRVAKERLLGPGVPGSSSAHDMSNFTIADDHDHDNENENGHADGGQLHSKQRGEYQYQSQNLYQPFDPRHRPVHPQPVVPASGSVPGSAQGSVDGTHGGAADLGAGCREPHGQAHADRSGHARPGPSGGAGEGVGVGAGGGANSSEGAGPALLLPVSSSAGVGEEAQLQPVGAGAGGWGGTVPPLPQAPLLTQQLPPQVHGDWRGQQHGEGPPPPPSPPQQQGKTGHLSFHGGGGRSSSGDIQWSGPHSGPNGASEVPSQGVLGQGPEGLLPQGGAIGEVYGSGGPAAGAEPPPAAPPITSLSPPLAPGAPLEAVLEGQPPGRPAAGQGGVAWS